MSLIFHERYPFLGKFFDHVKNTHHLFRQVLCMKYLDELKNLLTTVARSQITPFSFFQQLFDPILHWILRPNFLLPPIFFLGFGEEIFRLFLWFWIWFVSYWMESVMMLWCCCLIRCCCHLDSTSEFCKLFSLPVFLFSVAHTFLYFASLKWAEHVFFSQCVVYLIFFFVFFSLYRLHRSASVVFVVSAIFFSVMFRAKSAPIMKW